MVKLATIGFTKTNAENFFERLIGAGVKKVVDIRLHNKSQLSGFAKAADLPYFLSKIGNIQYVHRPELAPTDLIFNGLKKEGGSWEDYERQFLDLMERRKIESKFRPDMFEGACLLCAEDKPHFCHRRLVCEYLNDKWGGILDVTHL